MPNSKGTHCDYCGEFVADENIQQVHGYDLCPDCIKNQVFTCADCGDETVGRGETYLDLCHECETEKMYRDYVSTLDIISPECETIFFPTIKRIQTRPLMSRLRHSYGDAPDDESKKPIDVLFLDNFTEEYVVIYNLPDRFRNLPKYGCTFTKLKEKGLSFLRHGKTCKEFTTITLSPSYTFHIWERPYCLHAQTISDMNYGDRWEGRDLVWEGNKYGDTTKFFIIGYLDKGILK